MSDTSSLVTGVYDPLPPNSVFKNHPSEISHENRPPQSQRHSHRAHNEAMISGGHHHAKPGGGIH